MSNLSIYWLEKYWSFPLYVKYPCPRKITSDYVTILKALPLACLVFNTFIIPLLYTQREKYVYKLKKKKEGKRIDKTKWGIPVNRDSTAVSFSSMFDNIKFKYTKLNIEMAGLQMCPMDK